VVFGEVIWHAYGDFEQQNKFGNISFQLLIIIDYNYQYVLALYTML
jgi:hypothetical protein